MFIICKGRVLSLFSSYLCLDFDTGETTKTYDFPTTKCKSGFRSQIVSFVLWTTDRAVLTRSSEFPHVLEWRGRCTYMSAH